MRRDQLEHAIRTACQIVEATEVIVVGSQAILGTYLEEDLPAAATMSAEIDILPIADDNEETIRLGDLIEATAGELSPFEGVHGFSIDGVDLKTSAMPDGWRHRLVKVQNANTAAPSGEPQAADPTIRLNHSERTTAEECALLQRLFKTCMQVVSSCQSNAQVELKVQYARGSRGDFPTHSTRPASRSIASCRCATGRETPSACVTSPVLSRPASLSIDVMARACSGSRPSSSRSTGSASSVRMTLPDVCR
jgi:hypothetical protein